MFKKEGCFDSCGPLYRSSSILAHVVGYWNYPDNGQIYQYCLQYLKLIGCYSQIYYIIHFQVKIFICNLSQFFLSLADPILRRSCGTSARLRCLSLKNRSPELITYYYRKDAKEQLHTTSNFCLYTPTTLFYLRRFGW